MGAGGRLAVFVALAGYVPLAFLTVFNIVVLFVVLLVSADASLFLLMLFPRLAFENLFVASP